MLLIKVNVFRYMLFVAVITSVRCSREHRPNPPPECPQCKACPKPRSCGACQPCTTSPPAPKCEVCQNCTTLSAGNSTQEPVLTVLTANCPSGWKTKGGRCFFGQSCRYAKCNYEDATRRCTDIGGKLAQVTNQEDAEFMLSNAFGRKIWVDGTDSATEGTWIFKDETPMTYFNWHTGSSNTIATNCVYIKANSGIAFMYHVDCTSKTIPGFLCEL